METGQLLQASTWRTGWLHVLGSSSRANKSALTSFVPWSSAFPRNRSANFSELTGWNHPHTLSWTTCPLRASAASPLSFRESKTFLYSRRMTRINSREGPFVKPGTLLVAGATKTNAASAAEDRPFFNICFSTIIKSDFESFFWVFNHVLLKVPLKNSFFILKKFTFDFTHYFMSSVTHTFPHGLSAHGFYAQKIFFFVLHGTLCLMPCILFCLFQLRLLLCALLRTILRVITS